MGGVRWWVGGDGEAMERRWRGGGEAMERWWRGGGEVVERWWRGGGEVVERGGCLRGLLLS